MGRTSAEVDHAQILDPYSGARRHYLPGCQRLLPQGRRLNQGAIGFSQPTAEMRISQGGY